MGEVNIAQGDLQSFLRTAELLQIKGLAENVSWNPEADNEDSQAPSSPEPMNSELGQSSDSLCASPTQSQYSNTSQTPGKPNVKRRRLSSGVETPKLLNDSINNVTNQNNANKMEDDIDFKEEINDLEEESNLYVDESVNSEGELLLATDHKTFTNIQKNSSVDANDNTESNMGPNHKKCVQCGIVMLKKNFARHMRDMHTMPKPRSLCPLCQKSYKTPDWLKDHIRRGHGYTKELTDQLMSSIKTTPTKNSESQHDVSMQKLSLHDTKVPPLVPISDMKEGKPNPSLALIDIQSQPMTILTSQSIVKQEGTIPNVWKFYHGKHSNGLNIS